MLPSMYTLSPFLQYLSAMSARPEPLLFQSTTRCHSVFSCFSPDWFFHCRLVASDSVATREPFEVLRTSGIGAEIPDQDHFVQTPAHMHLQVLRGATIMGTRLKCRSRSCRLPNLRFGDRIAPATPRCASASRSTSASSLRISIVRGPLAHRPESMTEVQGLGRPVRLPHLEKHLVHVPAAETPRAPPRAAPRRCHAGGTPARPRG